MEFHCEVVRNLTAHRNNHAARIFQVDDVQNPLKRQFVKIQTVAHIVVGGYGFGIVINHNRLVTEFAGGIDGIDATPIELHRRTNPVST